MVWTAPRTWVDAEVATAALFNTYIRDNMAALRNGNLQYCKLFLGTSPSIPNNVFTTLSWTDVAFQVGTVWSAVNPTRLVAPIDGIYLVAANIEWRSVNVGMRAVSVVRNAPALQIDLQRQDADANFARISGMTFVQLVAGNYVEIRVFQDRGSSLTVHGGAVDRTRVAFMLWGQ